MTFLAGAIDFAFYGAKSPASNIYLKWCFAFSLDLWWQVTAQNRLDPINSVQRLLRKLFAYLHMIGIQQMRLPSCSELSHPLLFVQNVSYLFFWYPCSFSYGFRCGCSFWLIFTKIIVEECDTTRILVNFGNFGRIYLGADQSKTKNFITLRYSILFILTIHAKIHVNKLVERTSWIFLCKLITVAYRQEIYFSSCLAKS